jgi:N-acetylneuraminic acid mutarotase
MSIPQRMALAPVVLGFSLCCALGCGSSSSNGGPTSTTGGAGGVGTGGTATGGTATAGTGTGGTATAGSSGMDPAPGTYGTRAALPAANSECAVAECGGKIYVLGGYPSSRVVQTTVQVYDPALDSWALSVPLPLALHHPVAACVGGKLYSLGGQLADASGLAGNGATGRTLVLDPAQSTLGWTDLAPMPTARGAGASAVIDDRIYVAGGRDPANNAFEVYDVGDDTWAPLADVPRTFPGRNHLAATAISGKVYLAGGRYSGGSFSDPMTDSLDVFDPAIGTWAQLAPMLRPRGGVNGIALFGCFFVWGGEGTNTGEPGDVFPDHDVYSPLTDTWTALDDLPVPVHGITGAATLGGVLYMPGGGTMQGGSSGGPQFQVYRPNVRCDGT